jgi:hypothetical protein
MRLHGKNKLLGGVISAVAAAALALGLLAPGALAAPNPGPPLTTNPDGPQTSNIPYVAWVGEHVRLVACDPSISPTIDEDEPAQQFATFSTEDWSGYQFQPPTPDGFAGNNLLEEFAPGPSAFFPSSSVPHKGDGCVATIYKSLNPGLARIKVDVREASDPGQTVFSHQFLVIWLTASKPVLHESGLTGGGTETFQDQLNDVGKSNLKQFLGDPSGDGEFTPSPFEPKTPEEDLGLVQIKVSGKFPVITGTPLSNILPDDEYTLPTDWATLAKTLSSSSEATDEPGDNPGLWDIHGTPGRVSGSPYEETGTPQLCTTGSNGLLSSTDNCNGTEAEGATEETTEPGSIGLRQKFSRVFGDLTSEETSTIGPFDPQLANQTLLSDGALNEDDAPMPAMRLDVSIAPSNHTLGGVGQILGAKKARIYSHDFTGDTTAHNLYNPYYGAYIPATDRPGFNEVSGIAGPDHGSDFPGFLNEHPNPYPFWKLVPSSTSEHSGREEEQTHCLRRTLPDELEYASPSGHLTETLYTDERGEAYVVYKPGDAFYLNRLPKLVNPGEDEEGKVESPNADKGCDLKGVYGHEIGKALISARAIYPYEPVDYPSVESEKPLEKKIISKWEKQWFVFRKCVSTECSSARIIVAKAQDIDGRPIKDEQVCFAIGGFAGAEPFTGDLADPKETVFGEGSGEKVLDLGGTGQEEHPGSNELCLHTNSEGLAAILLFNGSFTGVDLPVHFVDEGILRDHEVEPKGGTKEESNTPKVEQKAPAPTIEPTPIASVIPLVATTTSPGSTSVAGFTAAKPLTATQKLHKALDVCKKKKPKKARLACEAQARKAFQGKTKKKKAPGKPPAVGLG